MILSILISIFFVPVQIANANAVLSEFTYNFQFDSRAPCRNNEGRHEFYFERPSSGAKVQFTQQTEFEDSGLSYYRCDGVVTYRREAPIVVSTFVLSDPDENGVISDKRGIFESYSACYSNAINQAHRLHDQGMNWLDYSCHRETNPYGSGRYFLKINGIGPNKLPLQGLSLTAANAHSVELKAATEKLFKRRGQILALERNGSYLYYADHAIFIQQTLGYFFDSELCEREKPFAGKVLSAVGSVDHEILCIENADPSFKVTKLVSVQAEGRKAVRTDFSVQGSYGSADDCEADFSRALMAFEAKLGMKPAGAICEVDDTPKPVHPIYDQDPRYYMIVFQ